MVAVSFLVNPDRPDAFLSTAAGRDLWALERLIEAGEQGCTPIDQPAPRWSAYIHRLRGLGLAIDTITENHDGPFPGHHARYVLRSSLRKIERENKQ